MSLSFGIALEDKSYDGPRYYGKYPAQIVNNQDPDHRGRITVLCPDIYDKYESDWAEACFPPGLFFVPPEGSYVWVEFRGGNPHYPIWSGVFYPEGHAPTFAGNTPDNLAIFTTDACTNGNILIQAANKTKTATITNQQGV